MYTIFFIPPPFLHPGNGGYDQINPMHDYSQNYTSTPNQPGYNTNGYSQYTQPYSQQVEYDHSQGYSQEYKWSL